MISMVRPSFFRSIWMAVMPFLVPAHLEVHLAVEVLHALDVDEGGEGAVVVLDQAQEMPATGALMGTPAS